MKMTARRKCHWSWTAI